MPTIVRAQNSFTGGVISEKLYGRIDLPSYQNSMADLLNFKVQPHGGLIRRSGTKYCWQVKNSAKNTRLIPFEYSADDSYILEFGENYIRFGKSGVLIESGGNPVELPTDYADDEIFQIKFVQSGDVMWLVHPNHAPVKLLRYSDTEWYLDPVVFIDGPYLPQNISSIAFYASAATGSVTLTAALDAVVSNCTDSDMPLSYTGGTPTPSHRVLVTTSVNHGLKSGDTVTIAGVAGTTEANGTWVIRVKSADEFELIGTTFVNSYTSGGTISPHIFAATDIGRLIRIWSSTDSKWAWGTITAYTSASVVTVDVVENNFPLLAAKTSKWKLGKFSDATGHPASVMLYELRLVYAGANIAQQDVDFSQTDLFNWFQIAADENLLASDAVGWTLQSNSVDSVAWLMPGRGGLAVGTTGGCWVLTGSGGKDDPITGDGSFAAKRHVVVGCDRSITPATIDNAVIFVDKSGRRLHEFAYLWEDDTYRAPDLTILADHLFRDTRIKNLSVAVQDKVVWVCAANGLLYGLTYMRPENVMAWHRHEVYGGDVEDACCITEGYDSTPYLVVRRLVGGAVVKYVERVEPDFDSSDVRKAYYLDCGASHNTALVVTDISLSGTDVVVTSVSHGLVDLDTVEIEGVEGMTDLNGNRYKVDNLTDDTFALLDATTEALIDGSAFGTYLTGGEVRKVITSLAGLDHLEGETVTALVDGKVKTGLVVASGAVTIPAAAIAHAGYAFVSDAESLPMEVENLRSGATIGRMKDIGKVAIKVTESYGCKVGRSFDDMETLIFNENLVFGAAPTLFTGEKSVYKINGQPATDVRICLRQDLPLPLSINAVVAHLEITED